MVLIIVMKQPKYTCELQREQPKFDPELLKNITSKNNTAIANFAGFIVLHNDTNVPNPIADYLPLELVSISQQGALNDSNGANLTLSTSCCDITLIHTIDPKSKNVIIKIQIENISSDRNHVSSCLVSTGLTPIPRDSFYSCQNSRSFYCEDAKNGTIAAILKFQQLEFEIDGDPNIIEQGRFSKQKRMCEANDHL